jgi:hypothetical protein
MWDGAGTVEEMTTEAADCAEAAPHPVLLPPTPGAVLFIEAEHHHCRWPLWDGETQAKFVCGSPRHSASTSYCHEHWIASGRALASGTPSTRYLGHEPRAVVRQRFDLLTLRRSEGF